MHLLANILHAPAAASTKPIALLTRNWRKDQPDWMAYAQFNLGVALVREDKLARGRSVPDAGGHARDRRAASCCALKDRANLALGFAYLQAQPAAAARARARARAPRRAVFEQGAARHGLGAMPRSASTRRRSTPWMELRERNLLDCRRAGSPISPCRTRSASSTPTRRPPSTTRAPSASFDSENVNLDDADRARSTSGNMLDTLLERDEDDALRLVLAVEEAAGCAASRAISITCSPATISRKA